jgi:cell division protein FtsQ
VALPLLAGGWTWLRHSSLVSVQSVHVSGVHGPEPQAIESALSRAARRMSTLDVNRAALRAAVAPFALVRDVRAAASFPHRLNIRVIEQPPVAALVAGGARTAVASNGVVLGQALLSSSLPTVAGSSAPATGARVRDWTLREALAVLGAAPGPFAKVSARVFSGPQGLTVAMRNGLLAYFGDGTRPHAKWLSLARVLADSSSAGASYVDVREPEHPAAGFPSGSPPAAANGSSASGSEAGAAASPSGSEEAIAAIAARLAGPRGSESAVNPAEAAASPASESQSPSGATEAGAATTPETTQAPAGEPQVNGETPATKGH